MTIDPRTPVVIGGGQISHRAEGLADSLSPVELMAHAVRRAAEAAGLSAVPAPDSIRVIELLSWRYRDPARFVAAELGVTTRETALVRGGGNSPQAAVNLTAAQIQRGELDLAILTGAEAWRTRMRARSAGVELPWPVVDAAVEPDQVLGTPMTMNHPLEAARGIVQPVQMYPIFETAIRAAAGRGVEEHLRHLSELWARFSAVAAGNEHAWTRTARSAEEIRTTGPSNRMIGLPYPKLMNSNNDVDQGAAVIVCSAGRARALGIPEDRWVFVVAGTDCHEHNFASQRWAFAETPAIRRGGQRVLELAGLGIDDIGLVDLYSCFPSAVQLGAASLGLELDRQLTRTGGLAFAGGPWNSYVMHAIATITGELRSAPGEYGLVWANGGFATKHSFGIYSTTPPVGGFRHDSPQAAIDALPQRTVLDPESAAGAATIEGYTVMHARDGSPEQAIASCLLADGRRAWGTSNDADTAAALCEGEWVGRAVHLDPSGTLRP